MHCHFKQTTVVEKPNPLSLLLLALDLPMILRPTGLVRDATWLTCRLWLIQRPLVLRGNAARQRSVQPRARTDVSTWTVEGTFASLRFEGVRLDTAV